MRRQKRDFWRKWVCLLLALVAVCTLLPGITSAEGDSEATLEPLTESTGTQTALAEAAPEPVQAQTAAKEPQAAAEKLQATTEEPQAKAEEPQATATAEEPQATATAEEPQATATAEEPQATATAEEPATPDAAPVDVQPFVAGDLTATLRWINVPTGPLERDQTFNDPGHGRDTQTVTYALDLHASNTSYATGQLSVRIPRELWKDRNGNSILPTRIAVPQAPTPGTAQVPFNYRIDGNDIVFTNTAPTVAGQNYEIQVQYANVIPWNTIDTSKATLQARASGRDSENNTNTSDTQAITYTVNTGVKLDSLTKGDPRFMYYWDPALTGSSRQPADFNQWRWVSWLITPGGTSNQPYRLELKDISAPGGEVYAVSYADANRPYASLNPADYSVQDSQTVTSKVFTDPTSNHPANQYSYYGSLPLRVLVRYPRSNPSNALVNNITATVRGVDPTNKVSTLTASADATWVDYNFTYTGPKSSFRKYDEDYWFSGEYDHASKLALLRNNKDVNVSWSVDNGVNLYNGTNVTAPAGARYSGEVTDDFVNWRIVDGNNASTDPWLRMTAADYSYTSVQLRGAANRIDRQSGRPIYYSQGKNGPLITVQAFANGAWTDVGQANAGELQYSNSNGGASSTNLGFDLPANTTRVRARYTNGEDYLYVRLDLTATLKASSPTLRTWLASNPANSGKRLRLQNFAYYNVTDQAGTNITPPPPSYSFSAIQGVNENLERDDIRDYGARVNRGTAAATLSDLAGGSNALKVAGAPVNDPANSRVNIPYALHGAEFYAGLDSGNLTELIATGWKPPARDEAVFYDLLPLGSFYNAALPTTAYDVHGNAAATVSVRTINDYKDSGRQMVVFTVKSNTPGQNYTKPFTSTYARPAVVADGTIAFVWPGAAPSFNTGYTVMFSASTPWDHVPYGRNGVNLASYQVAEENPLLGGGYVDNGDVAPHNAVKDPSGRNIFNDVRGNGVNAIRDTQYMSAPVSINVPVASASGLDKKVRSDAQGPLTPFKEEDTTRPNGDYTYQLRVGTVAGTRMRDVVLFDILEDTRNVDEHSTEQGWKGRFDDITLNYAEQTGIRPRVYYSTRTGLRYSTPPLTKASLSDTDTWSTTQPANKASITAIAVDLSTARNGQPFIFDSNTGTQVLVHMKAPATLPNVPNAYNKAAFYSVLIPAVGPETSSTVTGTHTQINMIDDPRFVKSSNPAGGTNATNATSLQPDQVVTYTLTYNPGIANAQGITVSDPVPAGMTFEPGSITFTAAGSTAPTPIPDSAYNAGTRTITWPTYNQATAGAATFTFRAKADALPSGAQGIDYRLYSNTGTVTRTNMPPQPPSNTITHEQRNRWADITKTAALVVDAPPTPANPTPTPTPTSPPLAQSAQSAIMSPAALRPDSATAGTVQAENSGTREAPVRTALGQIVEYHLTVTNTGANQLSGPIDVTDAVPAGMTYVPGSAKTTFSGSSSPSQATSTIDDSTGTIKWTLNQMSHQEQARLVFRAMAPDTLLRPGDPNTQASRVFENTAEMTDRGKNRPPVKTTTTYHIVEERTVVVRKLWTADNNATDVNKPTEVKVQLMANSMAVGTPVLVRAADNWTYTWTKLPIRNAAGQAIKYTTVEVGDPKEYQVAYSGDTFTITNHYSPGRTSRTIVKSWDDEDDQDGLRPTEIQVQLFADDVAHGTPITLSESNNWRHTWGLLPMVKSDATPVKYTVKEQGDTPDYEMTYDADNLILTNTYTPEDPPEEPTPPPTQPTPTPPQATPTPPQPTPPQATPTPPQPRVSVRIVRTDDPASIWPYFFAVAAAGAVIAGAVTARRRSRKKEQQK